MRRFQQTWGRLTSLWTVFPWGNNSYLPDTDKEPLERFGSRSLSLKEPVQDLPVALSNGTHLAVGSPHPWMKASWTLHLMVGFGAEATPLHSPQLPGMHTSAPLCQRYGGSYSLSGKRWFSRKAWTLCFTKALSQSSWAAKGGDFHPRELFNHGREWVLSRTVKDRGPHLSGPGLRDGGFQTSYSES